MFNKRLVSGSILIIILLSAVFWFPRPLVAVVVGLLMGVGLWEFYAISEIKGFRPFKVYGISCGVILSLLTYYFSAYDKNPVDYMYILLFLVIFAVLVRHAFVKDSSSVIANSAITLIGIMYVSFLFTFIIKLRYVFGGISGIELIMALFIITKVSDISAYICGTQWGRHKLIPRISAKKTIEGSVFGIAGAVSASLLYRIWFIHELGWGQVIVLGVLLSIIGQIGDLVESLIKRDAQVKDSGKMFPGMGGVLDFMDSLLFAGPAMYVYLKLVL